MIYLPPAPSAAPAESPKLLLTIEPADLRGAIGALRTAARAAEGPEPRSDEEIFAEVEAGMFSLSLALREELVAAQGRFIEANGRGGEVLAEIGSFAVMFHGLGDLTNDLQLGRWARFFASRIDAFYVVFAALRDPVAAERTFDRFQKSFLENPSSEVDLVEGEVSPDFFQAGAIAMFYAGRIREARELAMRAVLGNLSLPAQGEVAMFLLADDRDAGEFLAALRAKILPAEDPVRINLALRSLAVLGEVVGAGDDFGLWERIETLGGLFGERLRDEENSADSRVRFALATVSAGMATADPVAAFSKVEIFKAAVDQKTNPAVFAAGMELAEAGLFESFVSFGPGAVDDFEKKLQDLAEAPDDAPVSLAHPDVREAMFRGAMARALAVVRGAGEAPDGAAIGAAGRLADLAEMALRDFAQNNHPELTRPGHREEIALVRAWIAEHRGAPDAGIAEDRALGFLTEGGRTHFAKKFSVAAGRAGSYETALAAHHDRPVGLLPVAGDRTKFQLTILEALTSHTIAHSTRLAHNFHRLLDAAIEAGELEIPPDEISPEKLATSIVVGAMLHDVGKIRVAHLINKPRRLSDAEYAVVVRHPSDGARMVRGYLAELADRDEIDPDLTRGMIEDHHLSRDQIAKKYSGWRRTLMEIMSADDIFTALTEGRSYNNSMLPEVVLKILAEEAGEKPGAKIAPWILPSLEKMLGEEVEAGIYKKRVEIGRDELAEIGREIAALAGRPAAAA